MKVTIYTSGIKHQSRKRPVDADHAQVVWDLVKRGYHVSVRDESIWSVSFFLLRGEEGKPVFINQPEGTIHSLQARPHKGSEDARLLDEDYPNWVWKLYRHMAAVRPSNIHFTEGAADG